MQPAREFFTERTGLPVKKEIQMDVVSVVKLLDEYAIKSREQLIDYIKEQLPFEISDGTNMNQFISEFNRKISYALSMAELPY